MEAQIYGETAESYVASWKVVAEKVEQILNPEAKAIVTFEPLYSRVYRNVCDGFSKQMHLDLITLCSKHLQGVNQKLCSHDEISIGHLLSVHQSLKTYLISVKIISSIFSYLNRFYVTYCFNADLCIQLAGLFSQIIISERISALMCTVEEALKTPFSVPPEVLHNFFNELQNISNGEYAVKYFHLFSRYCPNVLPPMKECDLENHMAEVFEFMKTQRQPATTQEKQGVKRPAEDPVSLRLTYCHRKPKSHPLWFH